MHSIQAKIDLQDLDKETPLFYAVREENSELVKTLLANKADNSHKNSSGNTVYQLAVEQKNQILMDLLK